jgi:hypothetical protein
MANCTFMSERCMNMRHRSGGNPGDLFTVRLPLFLCGEMLRKRHRLDQTSLTHLPKRQKIDYRNRTYHDQNPQQPQLPPSKLGVGKMHKTRAIPSSQAIWRFRKVLVAGERNHLCRTVLRYQRLLT